MAEHNDFGKIAENYVAMKYEKNGYTILKRNWYHSPAEIDIIAQRDGTLVIVEVKARADDNWLPPELAVNNKKKRLLIAAADAYMDMNSIEMECRFDIAIVIKKKDGLAADIITDAFHPFELG
ncbi:MAG: YraN family protein [Weeksellaceae bacterium]|nr:YraN family protein [Weeksellaceae bacterium]